MSSVHIVYASRPKKFTIHFKKLLPCSFLKGVFYSLVSSLPLSSTEFFQRFAFLMASHRFPVVIHEVSTGAAGLISGALDISCGDFYQVNS